MRGKLDAHTPTTLVARLKLVTFTKVSAFLTKSEGGTSTFLTLEKI